jgi:hypothetical protein
MAVRCAGMISRDSNGTLVPDYSTFPSGSCKHRSGGERRPSVALKGEWRVVRAGMKGLADWMHSNGLLFGLYSARCPLTCQLRPGSMDHEFKGMPRDPSVARRHLF